jgi:RNA polymerase sigma factor (sigma-70 family)
VSTAESQEVIQSSTARAAKIFSLHGDFIRSVIRYRVKEEILVDDVFQDFFLSLVARPVPPDVRNIKNYLYRAIINHSFDAVKRVARYHDQVKRYANRIKKTINNDLPENALIEAEETQKMFQAIEHLLPVSESQAVTLKFRNDYNVGDVAKKMAVNRRSVSRYLSIGLKKLRGLLPKQEGAK